MKVLGALAFVWGTKAVGTFKGTFPPFDTFAYDETGGCTNCLGNAATCFESGCLNQIQAGDPEKYYPNTTWSPPYHECNPAALCLPCYPDKGSCGVDPFPDVCSEDDILVCVTGAACRGLVGCDGDNCPTDDSTNAALAGFPIIDPANDFAVCNGADNALYMCAARFDGSDVSGFHYDHVLSCGQCMVNQVYDVVMNAEVEGDDKEYVPTDACVDLVEKGGDDVCPCFEYIDYRDAQNWFNCLMPPESGAYGADPLFKYDGNLLEQWLECNVVPTVDFELAIDGVDAPLFGPFILEDVGKKVRSKIYSVAKITKKLIFVYVELSTSTTFRVSVGLLKESFDEHKYKIMENKDAVIESILEAIQSVNTGDLKPTFSFKIDETSDVVPPVPGSQSPTTAPAPTPDPTPKTDEYSGAGRTEVTIAVIALAAGLVF